LAARQMGMKPVWALGSVGAIGRLPVGSKIDELIILGEEGEPSQIMSWRCARHWWAQGRRVTIIMPKAGLSDMNDVVLARGGWRVALEERPRVKHDHAKPGRPRKIAP